MNVYHWIVTLVLVGLTAGHCLALEPPATMAASHVTDAECVYEKVSDEWSDLNRAKWYHCDQGTALMPYDWFKAMEMIGTNNLFIDAVKLFKLIPDAADTTLNPYGLPVGFTIIELERDPITGIPYYERDEVTDKPVPKTTLNKAGQRVIELDNNGNPLYKPALRKWVGVNCAFCHTGQIGYRDDRNRLQTLVIDGAPSMQDSIKFTKALFGSVGYTLGFGHTADPKASAEEMNELSLNTCVAGTNNDELLAFAARLGQAARLRALRGELCAFFVPRLALNKLATAQFGNANDLYPVEWGNGRLDAFGRAGNSILLKLDRRNLRKMSAPVSIPHVWGAYNYDWFQWNGSVGISLARSIGESIGVGAPVRFTETRDAPLGFTIKVNNLMGLESLRVNVPTPSWPAVFRPIDEAKVKRGARLYADKCVGCHGMIVTPGERNYRMLLIPLNVVGTDPGHARNYNKLEAFTGSLRPMLNNTEKAPAKDIIKYLVDQPMSDPDNKTRIIARYKIDFSLFDDNKWFAPLAYVARPNNGIWATPPFLHNGSVPNLYELLSPREDRSKTFCLGTLEFDQVKVGYKTDCAVNEQPFNTAVEIVNPDGTKSTPNSNIGHEFRNSQDCKRVETAYTRESTRVNKDDAYRDMLRTKIFNGEEIVLAWEQPGVFGCELSEPDRWALVEFLISSQDKYLRELLKTRESTANQTSSGPVGEGPRTAR